MERGGAARQCERMRHTDKLGEVLFEPVYLRPKWRNPLRVKRPEQQLALVLADVWRRQEDPRLHSLRARNVPNRSHLALITPSAIWNHSSLSRSRPAQASSAAGILAPAAWENG